MPQSRDKRIAALRAKCHQMEAEITRLEARDRQEARKADTRRKILVGAVILQEMQQQAEFDAWVRGLLRQRLTKPRDRKLFNLDPGDAKE